METSGPQCWHKERAVSTPRARGACQEYLYPLEARQPQGVRKGYAAGTRRGRIASESVRTGRPEVRQEPRSRRYE